MLADARTYRLKFNKILVPMARGERSRRALEIAYGISSLQASEITALTIKDEAHGVAWSDKVSLVTSTYREGMDRGIKIVPKIRTKGSARECIADEANSHGYNLLMVAAGKRSPLSASIFGGIGDYVLKNSRIPVVAVSVSGKKYPYRNILVPISENVNTRTAVSFAISLSKTVGSKLFFADLRSYDTKIRHGFHLLFEQLEELRRTLPGKIELMKCGTLDTLKDEINALIGQVTPDAIVLGVRTDSSGRIRMSSNVKSTIKNDSTDTILFKK